MRIFIGNESFHLVNVSNEGIGIRIEDHHPFDLGQRLAPIVIAAENTTRHYSGTVTHVTRRQDGIVCGIRFAFEDIDAYNHMVSFAKELTRAN
jgi:hypothetical protein